MRRAAASRLLSYIQQSRQVSDSHSSASLILMIPPFPWIFLSYPSPSPFIPPYISHSPKQQHKIYRGLPPDCRRIRTRQAPRQVNSGPPSKIARAQRRMENSQEISPLVSSLFPSDRGAARVSEDRDPCQTASLSNGRPPTYVVCLPKGGRNGGSTCAVADPSVALLELQAQ